MSGEHEGPDLGTIHTVAVLQRDRTRGGEMFERGLWVQDLRLEESLRLAPVCQDDTIESAVAFIGRDAVDWAIYQANEIALENVAAFPQIGGGPAQLATLRLGVESASLTILACIVEGRMVGPRLPAEAESQVRDFVHRRIPLTDQWAMIRQGHAALVQRLMNACIELAPPAEHDDQLRLVSRLAFEFIEAFSAEVARAYEAEQQRIDESAVISREAALRSLLDGEPADLADISRRLQYDVAFRWHQVIVLSREAPGQWDDMLTVAARGAMHSIGARQVLLVPQGHAVLWAFGNSPSMIDDNWDWTPPQHVRAAVGDPGFGPEGLRSSHFQALEAHRMSKLVPEASALIRFADINLLCLLLADPARAAEFVAYELKGLAAADAGTRELRRTLATYLETHNTQATASTMFLARNTVTYRLRKAEALLGHPTTDRQLETRIALFLAGLDGSYGAQTQ